MTYEQAIAYVDSYTKSGKPMENLARFVVLMRQLGNPHTDFRSIHIAGTNGKGSTTEYISNALYKSGKTVGKFTSPYITCIEERIQLNNKSISRHAFAHLCEQVKVAVDETGIDGFSQFEILTAIGFLYFSKEQVDYAVIETGIGGTLDCTNVITPDISVITSVDFDHTALLGDTIPEIASHKAGIIKPAVPCVAAVMSEEAASVIEAKAKGFGAELIIPDINRMQIIDMDAGEVFFSYKGSNYHLMMSGKHQIMNALCAIEACRKLGLQYGQIFTGLEKSVLPARMEMIRKDDTRYIIDGSHNPSAMRAARELLALDKRPVYAVIGMLKSKDWQGALKEILPVFAEVIFIDGFADGCVPKEELMQFAQTLGAVAQCEEDLSAALEKLCDKAGEKGYAMITGSLYLASVMRKMIKE
ncbi:MAG: bifunctional folylpolyglutamate synthase/dihydrofolate synthase [Ruminiclostridium sp.]|nr:bifunctional folylpolyglutamate synthase/dihydrofolate synthase [Ruminiclostridium sp.]